MDLIKQLIDQKYLKTPLIIEAFKKIDRKDFVLDQFKHEFDVNAPLPIGYGQTISQPLTVAFMLELLQPCSNDKILDIGAGSGWQTALLAYCVKDGKVFAVERIPELNEFGKKNVSKYNFIKKGIVEFICKDGSEGLIDQSPFDKIIAAAACDKVPEDLKKQLKINGRLVIPVKNSIWLVIKKSDKEFDEQEFPGFAFVPLIED